MYCVALTGSIASGKSTVGKLFAQLGVELIEMDQIARELTAKGQPAMTEIVTHFGPMFLDADGHLQRRKLRDDIFKHPQQRLWLESLLHPLIRQATLERTKMPTELYYMIEIPLLFEKIKYPYLNRILVVQSHAQMQIQRIMQRDRHHPSQAKVILASQAPPDAYQDLADDILINDGNIADLEQKVSALHDQYLTWAQR